MRLMLHRFWNANLGDVPRITILHLAALNNHHDDHEYQFCHKFHKAL